LQRPQGRSGAPGAEQQGRIPEEPVRAHRIRSVLDPEAGHLASVCATGEGHQQGGEGESGEGREIEPDEAARVVGPPVETCGLSDGEEEHIAAEHEEDEDRGGALPEDVQRRMDDQALEPPRGVPRPCGVEVGQRKDRDGQQRVVQHDDRCRRAAHAFQRGDTGNGPGAVLSFAHLRSSPGEWIVIR
ncbi:hypothetical protein ABE10_02785, partial [Bacillus toyonensis]|nr:hypothetical protein [Bacillus toyonensis]